MTQLGVESCLMLRVEPGIQPGRQPVDFFRMVVEHSPDAVLVLDRRGNLVFSNPAAQWLFGRSVERIRAYVFQSAESTGAPSELKIFLPGHETRVAEVRVGKMVSDGELFYIASLRDITELARQQERLRALSTLDELTSLYNRRGFFTFGEQRLEMANRLGKRSFLLFADLNGLKSINDRLGHAEGDRALIDVANILRRTFRKSDIIARIGGDEFTILAMESSLTTADTLLTRLEVQVKAHNQKEDPLYSLSLSTGVSCYEPGSHSSLEALLIEADRLMYAEKERGRMVNWNW